MIYLALDGRNSSWVSVFRYVFRIRFLRYNNLYSDYLFVYGKYQTSFTVTVLILSLENQRPRSSKEDVVS